MYTHPQQYTSQRNLPILGMLTFGIEIIVAILFLDELQLEAKAMIPKKGHPISSPWIVLWCAAPNITAHSFRHI
jgi:hypothetical protein